MEEVLIELGVPATTLKICQLPFRLPAFSGITKYPFWASDDARSMTPIKLELEFGLMSQRTSISASAVVPVNRIVALSGDEELKALGAEMNVVDWTAQAVPPIGVQPAGRPPIPVLSKFSE
jgi:hypothetical protein